MKYVLIFVGVFAVFFVGYATGAIVNNMIKKGLETATMSYGYEEKEQLWHRMRVDSNGKVVCSKEN